MGLPIVATNDAHYAKKEHYDAHDIHICLATGKERNDPNRMRYATDEFYLKSQDEMQSLFKDIPGGHSFDRIDTKIGREIRLKIWKFLAKELSPNQPIDNINEMIKTSYLR